MSEKLTVQEFASRLKQKYPSYQNMDDSTLVAKVTEKYPQYLEQIDFGEPEKKKNFSNYFSNLQSTSSQQPSEPVLGPVDPNNTTVTPVSEDYAKQARESRTGALDNGDGTHSTHRMAWGEADGKYFAFPTLFQDENGKYYEPDDPFAEARKKGELYDFGENQSEAEKFAAGGWKNDSFLESHQPKIDTYHKQPNEFHVVTHAEKEELTKPIEVSEEKKKKGYTGEELFAINQEKIDKEIFAKAHSPEGKQVYDDLSGIVGNDSYEFTTDPQAQQHAKEALLAKYGNENERIVDEILSTYIQNNKDVALYNKGIDDYTNAAKKELETANVFQQKQPNPDTKAPLTQDVLNDKDVKELVDYNIAKDISDNLPEIFNEDEIKRAKYVDELKSIYSSKLSPVERAKKVDVLKQNAAKNGIDNLESWINLETGYRQTKEEPTKEDIAVNTMITQYRKTPLKELSGLVKDNFVSYKGLKNEKEALENQRLKLTKELVTTLKSTSLRRFQQGEGEEITNKNRAIQEKIDAINDRIEDLNGTPENPGQLTQAKHRWEAATRAYMLNESPETYKGTNVKDILKTFGKSLIKGLPVIGGEETVENIFGATDTELQQALQEESNKGNFKLTDKELKAVKTAPAEEISAGMGSLVQFAGKLAVAEMLLSPVNLTSAAGALKAWEAKKEVGLVENFARTMAKYAVKSKYGQKAYNAIYEGVKFKAVGGDFGTGAAFSLVSPITSKLIPGLEKLAGSKKAIPSFIGMLAKADVDLTTASQVTELLGATSQSIAHNKDFNYEIEKRFGKDIPSYVKKTMVELATNWIIGVHPAIQAKYKYDPIAKKITLDNINRSFSWFKSNANGVYEDYIKPLENKTNLTTEEKKSLTKYKDEYDELMVQAKELQDHYKEVKKIGWTKGFMGKQELAIKKAMAVTDKADAIAKAKYYEYKFDELSKNADNEEDKKWYASMKDVATELLAKHPGVFSDEQLIYGVNKISGDWVVRKLNKDKTLDDTESEIEKPIEKPIDVSDVSEEKPKESELPVKEEKPKELPEEKRAPVKEPEVVVKENKEKPKKSEPKTQPKLRKVGDIDVLDYDPEKEAESERIDNAFRDELDKNGVSDKSEKLRKELYDYNKKHFYVKIEHRKDTDYEGKEISKGIINYSDVTGWSDPERLFFGIKNNRYVPNELGKKVGIKSTDASAILGFDYTPENIKLITDALEGKEYNVADIESLRLKEEPKQQPTEKPKKEIIEENAAKANLKEIKEKGFIRVADPEAVAEKIKKHTGVDVVVNKESGTIKLKEEKEPEQPSKPKEPWEMPQKDLDDGINKQEGNLKEVKRTINWGNSSKGQGKRSGGMIKGGMGDAPKGEKTYISYVPDYPEWVSDKMNKTGANPLLYAKAREYGLSHKEAGRYSILQSKYHKRAVENAIKEGKSVPKKVLKDYPDLIEEKQPIEHKEGSVIVINEYNTGKSRRVKDKKTGVVRLQQSYGQDNVAKVTKVNEDGSVEVEFANGDRKTLSKEDLKNSIVADKRIKGHYSSWIARNKKGPTKKQHIVNSTPQTIEDAALHYYISGGRMNTADYERELWTKKKAPEEFRMRSIWGLSGKAPTLDRIVEDLGDEYPHIKSGNWEQELTNALINVMMENKGIKSMMDKYNLIDEGSENKNTETPEQLEMKKALGYPDGYTLDEGQRIINEIAKRTGVSNAVMDVINMYGADWGIISETTSTSANDLVSAGLTTQEIMELKAIAEGGSPDMVQKQNEIKSLHDDFHELSPEWDDFLKQPVEKEEKPQPKETLEDKKQKAKAEYDKLQSELKKAEADYSKKKKAYETSDEHGGKGQSDIFGNVAGSDAIDFGDGEDVKKLIVDTKRKLDELRKKANEARIRYEKLNDITENQEDIDFSEDVSDEPDPFRVKPNKKALNIASDRLNNEPVSTIEPDVINPKEAKTSPKQKEFDKQVNVKVEKWTKTTNVKVKVINSATEIPERVKRNASQRGIDVNDATGFVDTKTGTVYVLKNNHETLSEIVKTLNHEIVVHKGLKTLLGEEWTSFLDDMYDAVPQDEALKISLKYKTHDRRAITEEWLASKAEDFKEAGTLSYIYQWLKQKIRNLFGIQYTDADIKLLFNESVKALRREHNTTDLSHKPSSKYSKAEKAFAKTIRESGTAKDWIKDLKDNGATDDELNRFNLNGDLSRNEVYKVIRFHLNNPETKVENVPYRIIGKIGLENTGDKRTLERLDDAMALEKEYGLEGKDYWDTDYFKKEKKAIMDRTGWFRGKDGKWRLHRYDNVKFKTKEILDRLTLDELDKTYTDKDIDVVSEMMYGDDTVYNVHFKDGTKLTINDADSYADAQRKAIQRLNTNQEERISFKKEYIGSLEDLTDKNWKIFKEYPSMQNYKVMAVTDGGTFLADVEVGKDGGTININRSAVKKLQYQGYTDKQIQSELRGLIIHEAQHIIQKTEGFERGSNFSVAEREYKRDFYDAQNISKKLLMIQNSPEYKIWKKSYNNLPEKDTKAFLEWDDNENKQWNQSPVGREYKQLWNELIATHILNAESGKRAQEELSDIAYGDELKYLNDRNYQKRYFSNAGEAEARLSDRLDEERPDLESNYIEDFEDEYRSRQTLNKVGGNIISKNESGKLSDADKEDEVKSGYIRLYRGLESEYDKNYDLSKTDAPTGYSTWTDNPELAREYAGKDGKVYYIDLPKSKLGNELIDKDGERGLFVNNEKGAGINGKTGNEYLVYNLHDDFGSYDIKSVEKGSDARNDVRFSFTSPTEDATTFIKQKKGTPEQMYASLIKNGAKKAELDWMGWDEFVKGKKSLTKEEIEQWVKENKIELKEVVKGDNELSRIKEELSREGITYSEFPDGTNFYDRNGGVISYNEMTAEQQWLVDEYYNNKKYNLGNDTKYSQYKLPGGTNYREFLLTMPDNIKERRFVNISDAIRFTKEVGGTMETNYSSDPHETIVTYERKKNFKSAHFDEPNIVVHTRTQDFTDIEGDKVLVMEENQSDWAQTGKHKGFKHKYIPEYNLNNTKVVKHKKLDGVYILYDKWGNKVSHSIFLMGETPDEIHKDLVEVANHNAKVKAESGIPDMPFKKTPQWVGLGLKRMMQEAAENGYDKLAWTTGEIQADRYDLSKQVDEVETIKKGNEYSVFIYKDGEKSGLGEYTEDKLPGVVGKDLAKKIVESYPDNIEGRANFKDLDLKVGGEGMTTFYDKIMVNTANKLFKKYGAKVETTEILSPNQFKIRAKHNGFYDVVDPEGNIVVKNIDGDKIDQWKKSGYKVYSVRLTPELIKAANGGFPMFKQTSRPKGENIFTSENKAAAEQHHKEMKTQAAKIASDIDTFVEVVQSAEHLPRRLRKAAQREGINRIKGLYDPQTDTVYIMADKVGDTKTLRRTILHEAVGHKGLRKVLGKDYSVILENIYKSMSQKDIDRLVKSGYNENDVFEIAEEHLAHMAESDIQLGYIDKAIVKLRNIIRKVFGLKYSRNDMLGLLELSRNKLSELSEQPSTIENKNLRYQKAGYEEKGEDKYKDAESGKKPLELPEIVKLIKTISGKYPEIRKGLGNALGQMRHFKGQPESGKILLKKALFELDKEGNQNLKLVEAVLGHELGHLIDLLPDGLIKRGNILGHISASEKAYRKTLLGKSKVDPEILTDKDRARLRREAKKQLTDEYEKSPTEIWEEIVTETPIYDESGITADDILAIWNDVDARTKYPDINDYISRLSAAEKNKIAKKAMKGIVDELMAIKFAKRIVGTKKTSEFVKRNVAKGGAPTVDDIRKRYKELIDEEVKKRGLFQKEEITEELKALTKWLHPFNEATSPKYTEYRYKPEELYAEAVSTLLNNPDALKAKAPLFFKAFFGWFDTRMDVKKAYEEIQTLISGGDVIKDRSERLKQDFAEGHEKRMKEANKKWKKMNGWDMFISHTVDRNIPGYKTIPKKISEGQKITDRMRVRNHIEMRTYLQEQAAVIIDEMDHKVVKRAFNNNIDIDDVGQLLYLNRVSNPTDRGGKANPEGIAMEHTQKQIDDVLAKYTPEQKQTINEILTDFHNIVFKTISEAHKYNIYSDDVWKNKIEPNKDTYATFAVVDYINNVFVSPFIHTGKGTFKAIENPLYSTTAKIIALQDVINRQRGWESYKKTIKENGIKDLIIPIKQKGNKEPLYAEKDGYEVIKVLEDGKPAYYEIPDYVKEMFDPKDYTLGFDNILRLLGFNAFKDIFTPIVTKYSPGWAFYSNVLRDSWRNFYNLNAIIGGYGDIKWHDRGWIMLTEYLPSMFVGLRESLKFQTNGFGKGFTDEAKEMLRLGMLYTGDYAKYSTEHNGSDILKPILIKTGMISKEKDFTDKWYYNKTAFNAMDKLYKAARTVIVDYSGLVELHEAYTLLGGILETSTKFGGYHVLKKHFNKEDAAFFTRNYIGTPNARAKGKISKTLNTVSPFFNVIVQSLRTGSELATDKHTMKDYWTTHFFTAAVPGIMMGMVAGLKAYYDRLTDDEKAKFNDNQTLNHLLYYSTQYNKIGVYHRLNYLSLLLDEDKNENPVFVRLQLSEEQRLTYAMSQYITQSLLNEDPYGYRSLLRIGVGMTPNNSPLFGLYTDWNTAMGGVSPKTFMGTDVLTQMEIDAGFEAWGPKMTQHTMDVVGLRTLSKELWKDKLRSAKKAYKMNNKPLLSRIIRTGGAGEAEYYERVKKKIRSEKARESLWVQKKVKDYISQDLSKNPKTNIDDPVYRNKMAISVLKEYTSEYNKNPTRAKLTSIRGLINTYTAIADDSRYQTLGVALSYAHSNDEKVAVMSGAYDIMDYYEYRDLCVRLISMKLISPQVMKMVEIEKRKEGKKKW